MASTWSAGGVIVVVVLCATILLLWILSAVSFVRSGKGIRVVGEVTGYGEYVSRGATMFTPLYRVTLADGQAVTGSASMSKSWKSPPIGACVKLFYDANNPESPLSDRGLVRFVTPAVLFVLGALFAAFLIAALVSAAG